jgi:hypothetical protein
MTSVEELVRRIITVMNSNDPVARALTLRTLGTVPGAPAYSTGIFSPLGAFHAKDIQVL